MDDAAAKRAAAAEARRQKILARGTDRLNRITVGTPIAAVDGGDAAGPSEAAAATSGAAPSDAHGDAPTTAPAPAAAPAPRSPAAEPAATSDDAPSPSQQQPAPSTVAQPDPPGTAPAAEPVAEPGSSSSGDADLDAETSQQMEQMEQALHALLNRLAFDPMAQGAPAAGALPPDLQAEPRQPPAQRPATAAPATAASPRGPATASPRAAGTGAVAPPSAAVARLAALLLLVLGPALTAAVERTRAVRLVLAVGLAVAVRYGILPGLLEAGPLPPVVLLLFTQVALIAGTHMVPSEQPRRLRLSKSTEALLGASGDAGADDDATAASTAASSAAAAGQPPPRFDWVSLVPGLRPFLDSVAAARSLAAGLLGDVSVYLVALVLMGESAGRGAMEA
ncbi:hypothetical protein HYH03_014776 [Edaphochlamys debaryana]|uniref:Uncharacterized protein n=1 Tax=Edaphochlamys debaryana TaxID=47281 RepID=A0A835XPJ8_9CHLO|nr:hypothetical protein HYH03_014776 [Edaphochlamys debaryana]|eukprot:KAG2486608.1 hypothetical protein HYH03_014776 [Edaphochlamys debaryana]